MQSLFLSFFLSLHSQLIQLKRFIGREGYITMSLMPFEFLPIFIQQFACEFSSCKQEGEMFILWRFMQFHFGLINLTSYYIIALLKQRVKE